MSRSVGVLIIVSSLLACGGAAPADTTVATTIAGPPETSTTTTTTPVVGDIGDLPPGCVDAMIDMLKEMEPIVDGVGLDELLEGEEFEGIDELTEIGERYEARFEDLGCPDTEGEIPFRQLIDLARTHAPGTVAYLEAFAAMADAVSGEEQDCDEVLIAADAFFDPSVSIDDLSPTDQLEAARLVTALTQNCPPAVVQEFMMRFDD